MIEETPTCGHQVLAPAEVWRRLKSGAMQRAAPTTYALLKCLENPGHQGDHRHTHVWFNRGQPGDSPK